MADAYDEVPRHSGKSRSERANVSTGSVTQRNNEIYMLFGDQRVQGFKWANALTAEARDPYGSNGAFYNWGVSYPSN